MKSNYLFIDNHLKQLAIFILYIFLFFGLTEISFSQSQSIQTINHKTENLKKGEDDFLGKLQKIAENAVHNAETQINTDNCAEQDEFEKAEEYQKRCKEFLKQKLDSRYKSIDILDLKKYGFEDEQHYKQRLAEFNGEARKRNPKYRAGFAKLAKYNAETETFPLEIQWNQKLRTLLTIRKGTISVKNIDIGRKLRSEHGYPGKKKFLYPVFITVELFEGELVAKDINLIGIGKSWPILLGKNIFEIKQGQFETSKQYKKRFLDAVINYNKAVRQYEPLYKAGTAFLNEFKQNRYSVNVKWKKWAKRQFDLLSNNAIHITREKAIQLSGEGNELPVFIEIKNNGTQVEIAKVFLVGLEKETWAFQSLKTETENNKEICKKKCKDTYDRCLNDKEVCKRVRCDPLAILSRQMVLDDPDPDDNSEWCRRCRVPDEDIDYCRKFADCQRCDN